MEGIDSTEYISEDDPRYDGFRIREFWILTAMSPDNMEAIVFVQLVNARVFHLAQGPAFAGDERRLYNLREYARWLAREAPGTEFYIRHFVPEGEPEIIKC